MLGALWAAIFFMKSNSKSAITYETSEPFISSIEKKTVATGKVVPEDEIEIKPQISGIIEKIYLEEGAKVKAGDLIAVIKVVPNEQSLNQAIVWTDSSIRPRPNYGISSMNSPMPNAVPVFDHPFKLHFMNTEMIIFPPAKDTFDRYWGSVTIWTRFLKNCSL